MKLYVNILGMLLLLFVIIWQVTGYYVAMIVGIEVGHDCIQWQVSGIDDLSEYATIISAYI
jgi:hypothetical protein